MLYFRMFFFNKSISESYLFGVAIMRVLCNNYTLFFSIGFYVQFKFHNNTFYFRDGVVEVAG